MENLEEGLVKTTETMPVLMYIPVKARIFTFISDGKIMAVSQDQTQGHIKTR